MTDAGGIAVVPTAAGPVDLTVGDVVVALEVEAEGDIVDVAVAWNGDEAAVFDGTPVRYAAGEASGASFVDPGTDLSDLEALLEADESWSCSAPAPTRATSRSAARGSFCSGTASRGRRS